MRESKAKLQAYLWQQACRALSLGAIPVAKQQIKGFAAGCDISSAQRIEAHVRTHS